MARMPQKRLIFFVVGALALAGLAFYFLGLPVSRSRLSLLRVGMTKNEVATILGEPNTVHDPVGGTTWIYEAPYHLFAVEVVFDGLGHYERHWKEL